LRTVLGLQSSPVIWPLGNGPTFKGVFDRRSKEVHLFERVPGGKFQAPVNVTSLEDDAVRSKLDDYTFEQVKDQLAMLDGAGHPFDLKAVQAGQQTPVYFGSAVNNFGIQLLLDGFLKDSVPPAPRKSVSITVPGFPQPTTAREVPVDDPKFSGFIFKIQANMDAKHRDRIAFCRVCSGKFDRDMVVTHQRTGKSVRLSSSHKLFGASARRWTKPGRAMSSASSATANSASATHLRRTAASATTRSRAFPPRSSPTSPTRTPGDSKKYPRRPRANSCKRALSSPSRPRARPPAPRCWPRSARCSSRSCNGACRANTAPSRV